MGFRRRLEMSLGREEFLRLLPAAIGAFRVDGQIVRWTGDRDAGTIRLVPLPDRQVGSLVVPTLQVEVMLEASSEAEMRAFMNRFDRAFLRGGG